LKNFEHRLSNEYEENFPLNEDDLLIIYKELEKEGIDHLREKSLGEEVDGYVDQLEAKMQEIYERIRM
jgi:hypothetical protein